MSLIDKQRIRELMKEGKLKDANDIQEMLKAQFAEILEEMLVAELDHELGYSKYDYKNKETTNSRNGKRNSTKYLSWKDRKTFCRDLKNVYQASTEESALLELDKLDAKWGDKYEIVLRSWRTNWIRLYLATMDIAKRWIVRPRNWSIILAQLNIHFTG